MKKGFLIGALLFIAPGPAAAFWWSLTEKEQQICENRASWERNEFSAKQAFERCKKSIRGELKKEKEERIKREQITKAKEEAASKAWNDLIQLCKSFQHNYNKSMQKQRKILEKHGLEISDLFFKADKLYSSNPEFMEGSEFREAERMTAQARREILKYNPALKDDWEKLSLKDVGKSFYEGWDNMFLETCEKPDIQRHFY